MIYVLLPAYNEEESLPLLVPKLKQVLEQQDEEYKIIVCDDGSSDKTAAMLLEYSKELPLEIITHSINRGLGESSRDLFERVAAITNEGDVVIRMDCDDTHEPSYMPSIIKKVRSGYDVVIASRFQPGGAQHGVSAYRGFISRCANLFMPQFCATGIKF